MVKNTNENTNTVTRMLIKHKDEKDYNCITQKWKNGLRDISDMSAKSLCNFEYKL